MKATVIGDGGWGTALASVLDRNGHQTTVWGPFAEYIETLKEKGENVNYLPGVKISTSIHWTADEKEALADADLVVLVVPSRFYRATVQRIKPFIPASALIVSATKGLDETTHERMSEVASKILERPVAVLSGPSHAEEVARQIPCAVSVAAPDLAEAKKIQRFFINDTFRVYTLTDVVGVELGGAQKM